MKKKTKTKTVATADPWAPAQPFILKNLQQQDDVFNAQQPELARYAGMQRDSYGKIAPGAEAGVLGSQNLVNDTLGGKYLEGNPHLDAILTKTRGNISDSVGSQFSSAGRYGSGYHADVLTRALADAENEARYGNYANERQNQVNAVGQAQSLMGGSQSLLNNAAELPWLGVQAANGAVRQASSGYGTQTSNSTQTQSGGVGSMLGGLAGAGLSGWASGGFKLSDDRVKENKVPVGMLPDGVGVFNYNFKGDPTLYTGVLASDVAAKRPDALGPNLGGLQTVDYGALGPQGAMLAASAGPEPGLAAPPPVAAPKPGFFGEGGAGRAIAGSLGDVLLQQAGMAPIYGPGVARQQEREAEDIQWANREKWRLANKPKPINDTERDFEWYKGLSEPDRKLYHQQKPTISFRADGTPVAINPYDITASSAPAPDTLPADFDFGQAPPAQTPQSDGQFMTPDQERAMRQSLGDAGYQAWQRKYNVPVRGAM